MKQKLLKAYRWIKSKIPYTRVKIPVLSQKEVIAELEIQLELRRLLSGFDSQYPHLFAYNPLKEYWVCFVTAMAYCESGYDRYKTFLEPAPLNYNSLGLLQLSHIDQNYYSFCDIKGDKIFRISNNLQCGLGILNTLVGKKKTPIFNEGQYWSVLQPKRSFHKKFLTKFEQLCSQNGVY